MIRTAKNSSFCQSRRLTPVYDAACRRCPRLADVPRRRPRRASGVLLPAGAAVRRDARAAGDRRSRARACMAPTPAAGRSPATMPASCSTRRCTLRLRVEARADRARRWAGAARLPDHQCREVPAAGQQAHARRGARRATATWPPNSRRCRRAARFWRWGASRTKRRCGRWRCAPADFPFAHGARHALAGDRADSTAIIAAATTPTRGG